MYDGSDVYALLNHVASSGLLIGKTREQVVESLGSSLGLGFATSCGLGREGCLLLCGDPAETHHCRSPHAVLSLR
jgi:hypothetical protein